jgi:hypothetical protein
MDAIGCDLADSTPDLETRRVQHTAGIQSVPSLRRTLSLTARRG